MVKAAEILTELESLGTESYRKTMKKHGAPDDYFGVKVGDMKKIVKRIKKDQPLAEELFATGNGDARYLAGLIADPDAVKITVLRKWAKAAEWAMICEYTVAGVAADSPHGWKLGLEWIDDKKEKIATSGWNALTGVISTRPDDELDLKAIKSLLTRVKKEIKKAPNKVRYTMNGFVIAVGCYVEPLSDHARKVAESIDKVEVDLGNTACKVPLATEYIDKVVKMGRVGKKRKQARC